MLAPATRRREDVRVLSGPLPAVPDAPTAPTTRRGHPARGNGRPEPERARGASQRAIDAAALAHRVAPLAATHGTTISARVLSRWLVREGLADEHDGRLIATPLGREIGGGITR